MIAHAEQHHRLLTPTADLNRGLRRAVFAGVFNQIHQALHHLIAIGEGMDRVGIEVLRQTERKALFAGSFAKGDGLLHGIADAQRLQIHLQMAHFGTGERQQIRHQVPQPATFLFNNGQLVALLIAEIVGTA